jgi:hypothetical protein
LSTVSRDRLRIVQCILPPIGLAATPVDLLLRETPEILRLKLSSDYDHYHDVWILLALCNWVTSGKTHAVSLEVLVDDLSSIIQHEDSNLLLISVDFWNQKVTVISAAFKDSLIAFTDTIPQHSAIVYAIRPIVDIGRPLYLGANIHMSCGKEIRKIVYSQVNGLATFEVEIYRTYMMQVGFEYDVWLYLPIPHHKKSDLIDGDIHCEVVEAVGSFGCIVKANSNNFPKHEDSNIPTCVVTVRWSV